MSSVLATSLAQLLEMEEAFERAHDYVQRAIQSSPMLRSWEWSNQSLSFYKYLLRLKILLISSNYFVIKSLSSNIREPLKLCTYLWILIVIFI